jgi:hypothetical protein
MATWPWRCLDAVFPGLPKPRKSWLFCFTKFGGRFIGQGQHIFLHAPPYFGFADRLM